MAMYHDGNRALQDRFGSRALADRLLEVTHRTQLTDADKAFVESVPFFFLATADSEGRPDCSFKGGAPGFVRVVKPDCVVFPDFDGNGMFKSLGNIRANPNIGMLFILMNEAPKRLRINGRAELVFDDPMIQEFAGAQLLVRVTPTHVFPNCPRNVPNMQLVAPSPYVPEKDKPVVEPAWKGFDAFKGVVPPRKR